MSNVIAWQFVSLMIISNMGNESVKAGGRESHYLNFHVDNKWLARPETREGLLLHGRPSASHAESPSFSPQNLQLKGEYERPLRAKAS